MTEKTSMFLIFITISVYCKTLDLRTLITKNMLQLYVQTMQQNNHSKIYLTFPPICMYVHGSCRYTNEWAITGQSNIMDA